jgi:hypothetical protein
MYDDIELIADRPNFQVYQLDYVAKNKDKFIEDSETAHNNFLKIFPGESSTLKYKHYNIFSLTIDSIYFHTLYNQLIYIIKQHHIKKEPLWFQSWINYHKQEEVLKWHNHYPAKYSGYISINPHKTRTSFQNYIIENKPGKLYIGRGEENHKVEVLENFNDPRITIAFDVYGYDSNYSGLIDKSLPPRNFSFFPIPI